MNDLKGLPFRETAGLSYFAIGAQKKRRLEERGGGVHLSFSTSHQAA